MTPQDYADLRAGLANAGLGCRAAEIEARARARWQDDPHGDLPRWRDTLASLASDPGDAARRRALLLSLTPWRKGPFDAGGTLIDAEWRSDLKWNRVVPHIESLHDRLVLDVGCGNGFYVLQMAAAGARQVIGLEPMLLYVVQFLAMQLFAQRPQATVLPLRLQDFPPGCQVFDTTFSMGVLYHQRSPADHLKQLRETLRPGGQLVLETLFLPDDGAQSWAPPGRYARMRNVWFLPTLAGLAESLDRAGFERIEVVDRSVTGVEEQRSTEWMPFESLAQALDPDDPSKTVEGWPAPQRAVLLARAP